MSLPSFLLASNAARFLDRVRSAAQDVAFMERNGDQEMLVSALRIMLRIEFSPGFERGLIPSRAQPIEVDAADLPALKTLLVTLYCERELIDDPYYHNDDDYEEWLESNMAKLDTALAASLVDHLGRIEA